MDSATSKLESGLQYLRQADTNPAMLGPALLSLHGALEDRFRAWLATKVPSEQRAQVGSPQHMQWKDLADLMQQYGQLEDSTRRTILNFNRLRNDVAHGSPYKGNVRELVVYSQVVSALLKRYSLPDAAPAQPVARPTPPPSPPTLPQRQPASPHVSRPARRSRLGWLIALGALLALAYLWNAAWSRPNSTPRQPTAVLAGEATMAPLPTSAPTATAAAPPTAVPLRGATVVGVGQQTLRVREGPSLNAGRLTLDLVEGTRVQIISGPVEADGHTWWQISVDGQQGWCSGTYLQLDEAAQ